MALNQSALLEVLDALKVAEVHAATCRYSRRTIIEQADTDAVNRPTMGPG